MKEVLRYARQISFYRDVLRMSRKTLNAHLDKMSEKKVAGKGVWPVFMTHKTTKHGPRTSCKSHGDRFHFNEVFLPKTMSWNTKATLQLLVIHSQGTDPPGVASVVHHCPGGTNSSHVLYVLVQSPRAA